jgi:hypothetical protein
MVTDMVTDMVTNKDLLLSICYQIEFKKGFNAKAQFKKLLSN